MQHRFVGDVSDFGKYGLLRFLTGMTDLTHPAGQADKSLAVVWYAHHEQHQSGDGTKTGFLAPTDKNEALYAACDRCLWDKLSHLVNDRPRCICCVQSAGVLPKETSYHDAPLFNEPGNTKIVMEVKEASRKRWLAGALAVAKGKELVYSTRTTALATRPSSTRSLARNTPTAPILSRFGSRASPLWCTTVGVMSASRKGSQPPMKH